MMEQFPILSEVYWNNTVQDYIYSTFLFIAGVIVLVVIEKIILSTLAKLTEKTETTLDEYVLTLLEKTALPVLYVGSFHFAVNHLTLTAEVEKLVSFLWVAVLTIQMTRLVAGIAVMMLDRTWFKRENKPQGIKASRSILIIVKSVIWGLGLVMLFDNLGFNVSAVIAGLGVGGVAVALAAQTILGDLFNYFVIFFDKPFQEGDFVIIDDYLGVIEHIGIKTTRIRSLGGEQLVFSNTDLTSSRVRNYKRMEQRRVLFKLGVTYQTNSAKVQKGIDLIKEVIASVKETALDRVHFQNFGDFSLDIEVVYYVLNSDYNKYMDIQQEINLKVMEAFEKEGIEFAYPTQTLFVQKES